MSVLMIILQREEVFGAWGQLFLVPVFVIALVVFVVKIILAIRDQRRDKFDKRFRDKEDWRNRGW
ncbi:MAG: hypothetical protein J6X91_03360 [Bacteroidales bacterium]|nr:hypothetical protein [Bacteroidales bacterium]